MAKDCKAITAICGPRSEPPMPMFTTSVMCLSARIFSANASMAFRVSCTSFKEDFTPEGKASEAAPCAGWRNNQCITALFSVVLMASPWNMRSRRTNTPACCANANNCASISACQRFFDRSANTPGAAWLKCAARPTSRANSVRKSKPANVLACSTKFFQAAV